jgi:hypothetical protein
MRRGGAAVLSQNASGQINIRRVRRRTPKQFKSADFLVEKIWTFYSQMKIQYILIKNINFSSIFTFLKLNIINKFSVYNPRLLPVGYVNTYWKIIEKLN